MSSKLVKFTATPGHITIRVSLNKESWSKRQVAQHIQGDLQTINSVFLIRNHRDQKTWDDMLTNSATSGQDCPPE